MNQLLSYLTASGAAGVLAFVVVAFLKGYIYSKSAYDEMKSYLTLELGRERENAKKWEQQCLQAWNKVGQASEANTKMLDMVKKDQ